MTVMPDYFLQRKKTVNRIDALCAALFELWCEEKKRVPLAYLLHCWPLTGHDPVSVKKIADALADLSQFQASLLSPGASQMIREVIGNVREIIGEPAPPGALAANGAGIMWTRVRLGNPSAAVAAFTKADFLDGPL
ncbi:hypothetical protein PQR14_00220 [Paraburkholderia bryophila]|uniref:hypothetical protein n=1 Tax=Burkholderiaceae TaxID=119060 RepID=UPI00068939BF|nr:hypothetical protein [Burkholderia sp. 9120]